MARDDAGLGIDQDRVVESELGDAGRGSASFTLIHLSPPRTRAQFVPGMIRKAEKPESVRPSGGTTAAKAVRTDTKLSYGVTGRYGAGY